MKRIIYLSLLLVIPFLVHADHWRDKINGKWISPFHNKVIKVKVKRNELRVKNLTRRGWTTFRPNRNGKFIDRKGNTILIKNIHELTYISSCGAKRIVFFNNGSHYHNHTCNHACSYHTEYDRYENYNDYTTNKKERWYKRNETNYNEFRIQGRYYVREINEYIIIEDTKNGLRARRSNSAWVYYKQNRFLKNKYIDPNGNTYEVGTDGSLRWKNRSGSIILNLEK